jgi:hypothetical protein
MLISNYIKRGIRDYNLLNKIILKRCINYYRQILKLLNLYELILLINNR